MAKKRVNELAREHDMPAKEVMERLRAAGIEVKAQASAVDEVQAHRALTGQPINGDGGTARNGAEEAPPRRTGPRAGPGRGARPAEAPRGPRAGDGRAPGGARGGGPGRPP